MTVESAEFQWAVMSADGVLHRGPFDKENEAFAWLYDAHDDGFPNAFSVFYVAKRQIGSWERVF